MMKDDIQNTQDDNAKLAAADFRTALVLLAITLFLFFETLTYPMSGDYAGVESQWYVSPALFPLVILSCLLLCSLILLVKSLRAQGYKAFFSVSVWFGNHLEKRIRDRWLVILLLIVYVYGLIPSVDFYLASVVFLLSLTSRFYYEIKQSFLVITSTNVGLMLALYFIKMHWLMAEEVTYLSINQAENVIFWSDCCAVFFISILLLKNIFNPCTSDTRKLITNSVVTLMVPLVLVMVFSYLLFVPMPVEYGSVVSMLDNLIYEVLVL